MKSPIVFSIASRRRLRSALPLLLVCGTAFASKPVPTTNLQSAEQAIANAERVEAASFAAVDLGEARSKLAAAQKAVSEKEMIAAAQLATNHVQQPSSPPPERLPPRRPRSTRTSSGAPTRSSKRCSARLETKQ
jgi:hypothetical protein